MLGWEIIEGEQRVAVLGEAFDRPAVLGAVFLGEDVERRPSEAPVRQEFHHRRLVDQRPAGDVDQRAFGAEELRRMPAEDGERLMHAHLLINGGSVMLADEFPDFLTLPAYGLID